MDHIIVLVHKIYTVSIPKPDDTEEWIGDLVEIDQEVKCCVNQIDNRSKPPFICATLTSDYSQGCKLSNSINNIDNTDSAIEGIKTEPLANGISEDDGVSEKEKKKHRKKHKKSREDNSNSVCKIESESESNDNLGNDISIINKSVKKHQSMQDTTLNTDDFLNNSEVDNIPKKQKKSKRKSLHNDDTISNDEYTESRKAVKRESSIPLDNITEAETKKRKKHIKKSKELNSDSEIDKKIIKSEKEHTHKKQSNTSLVSNNLGDTISKKHRKNKKASIKMSDSETEDYNVKIKIEKQDPDRIINESQVAYSETQIVQNFNKNLEMSKRVKREVSIESDISEKEKKKSPKKHTVSSRDSQSKLIKIKTEDSVSDIVKKEKKKKKLANISTDSDSEIRIKSENITNDINDISQAIKHDPKEEEYNTSAMDSSLNNSDLDRVSKKSKKRKTSTILSDLELESSIKIKTEKV